MEDFIFPLIVVDSFVGCNHLVGSCWLSEIGVHFFPPPSGFKCVCQKSAVTLMIPPFSITWPFSLAAFSTFSVLFLMIFFLDFIYLFHVWVFPECRSVHHVCQVPTKTRKGHQISGDWSYGRLRTTLSVSGIEPKSSRSMVSAINDWAIYSALMLNYNILWRYPSFFLYLMLCSLL